MMKPGSAACVVAMAMLFGGCRPAVKGTAQEAMMSRPTTDSIASASAGVAPAATTAPSTQSTTQPSTRPARPAPRTLTEALERFEIDDRLTLCHVWETRDGQLAGFVEYPEHRELLGRWLGKATSRVRLLPEEAKSADRFGIVTVPHALLRKEPTDTPGDRDNVSDLLLGEPIWILDRHEDGATLVHASDGYLGWVDAGAIWTVKEESFAAAIGAWGRQETDASVLDAIRKRDTAALVASRNAGRRGEVMRRRVDLVLNEAKKQAGAPYVWGGKTKEGIDCSGLVQTSFGRHGIVLPRDADQQANVGRLVATRWMKEGLLPGDLLFFLSEKNGNVHHVAIYLGEGRYIESAGEGVRVRSMTPGDADYDEARTKSFAWARRVIE